MGRLSHCSVFHCRFLAHTNHSSGRSSKRGLRRRPNRRLRILNNVSVAEVDGEWYQGRPAFKCKGAGGSPSALPSRSFLFLLDIQLSARRQRPAGPIGRALP
jgi:hypothetical protein